jgi:hypothetical protein
MATDVQIANLALTRIGHEGVTSFNASGNKAERWFAAQYEFIRQSLLREHAWRFAIKRTVLARDVIRTVTAVTATNPVVVTSAGHGFANGAQVYLTDLVGMSELNGRTFTVANQAANTFELSGEDGTTHTPYVSGGLAYGYVPTEFAYRFPLPADCLRLLRINDAEWDEYRVEQNAVLADENRIILEYIYDATDEATFDAQFVDVLAARLSAEVCFYLTDNQSLTEQSWQIANQKLAMARTMDSRQGTPRGLDSDIWTMARL